MSLCLCELLSIWKRENLSPSKPLLGQSTNAFAGLFLSPRRSHLLFIAVALELDICCEGFKSSSPRWIIGVSLFYLSTFVLEIANIKYKVCKKEDATPFNRDKSNCCLSLHIIRCMRHKVVEWRKVFLVGELLLI